MRKKVVLGSSVFLWQTSIEGFLYDWISGACLRFPVVDSGIRALCDQWEDLDNLYAARFNPQENDSQVNKLVTAIVLRGLGRVYDENASAVSFPPVLKINRSVERKAIMDRVETQPILPNLTHLRVFLGGVTGDRNLWKQAMFPMASSVFLEINRLRGFLHRCDCHSLAQIDLVISDWDAGRISAFSEGLSEMSMKEKVRFFFAHPDPGFNNEILVGLVADGYAVTQVCLPDKRIERAAWVQGRNYQLFVRGEEEAEYWERLLEGTDGVDYVFKPIADNNLEFFYNNVFLSEEEILSQRLTKKEIFRHQALNVNQFGTLYVFPDGTIHPAADASAIGTLEDPVHQTIVRELVENHAWRQTRRLMKPCKNCLYHDLCPSPSVYERIFDVPGCTYWRKKTSLPV